MKPPSSGRTPPAQRHYPSVRQATQNNHKPSPKHNKQLGKVHGTNDKHPRPHSRKTTISQHNQKYRKITRIKAQQRETKTQQKSTTTPNTHTKNPTPKQPHYNTLYSTSPKLSLKPRLNESSVPTSISSEGNPFQIVTHLIPKKRLRISDWQAGTKSLYL